ncbi:DUF2071 domain-containing protein [Halomicrobium salinisoli]|uniref:DUF2071 domain-containing protein n=1 Tax=Halomicrobium salinisoli TaxID=2878391 RepID=UPI001CEFB606|nr:DUF2071 domain-containing protein [Halomicrobium salinisoli]
MGWFPPLRGVVDRRILVNFRIDPAALADVLPEPFEPRTVDGVAIGGICCIRLRDVRPRGLPAALGVGAESAAHRIGVEWDGDDGRQSGVYVPRRDTDSRLVAAVGDRRFGRHGLASFAVREGDGRYELSMDGPDGVAVRFAGTETDGLPADSVFPDLAAAVEYHRCGSVGYSPSPDGDRFDGLEMAMDDWAVTPLAVESASASFFDELDPDAVNLDNALLMRDVGNELRPRASIPCSGSDPAVASD